MNLYDIFHQTARKQPGSPAILGPGAQDLSYHDLDEAVRSAGERLGRAGVRTGDCVGLHCPSGADYIALTYAVWRCGGCVVPIPVELTAGEKQEICRVIALDYLVSPRQTASFAEPLRAGDAAEISPGMAVV